jgi:hypothetical protein
VIKKLLQAAAVVAACSGAAHASTFDFSYTFTDGQTVTGSLDGTQNGDLVTDISNVSVDFQGTVFTGTLYAGTFNATSGGFDYSPNAAVVSTNGLLNNFIFADNTDPAANNVTNFFYYINNSAFSTDGTPAVSAANFNPGANSTFGLDSPAAPGQWSLAPVPVPAALPLMISGLGLLAAARRRRQNRTAQG